MVVATKTLATHFKLIFHNTGGPIKKRLSVQSTESIDSLNINKLTFLDSVVSLKVISKLCEVLCITMDRYYLHQRTVTVRSLI